jgi:DNA-binding response OmpR family regulator
MVQRDAQPVHVLLTDVVMPGLSGRELATQLAEIRPDVKVLYTSGYTDDAILRHGVLDAGAEFIGKPYTKAGLLARVRSLLDGDCREPGNPPDIRTPAVEFRWPFERRALFVLVREVPLKVGVTPGRARRAVSG